MSVAKKMARQAREAARNEALMAALEIACEDMDVVLTESGRMMVEELDRWFEAVGPDFPREAWQEWLAERIHETTREPILATLERWRVERAASLHAGAGP